MENGYKAPPIGGVKLFPPIDNVENAVQYIDLTQGDELASETGDGRLRRVQKGNHQPFTRYGSDFFLA